MRLTIEKARKVFGRTIAVDAVDLQVAPGEFCVLLGPSGCGKSTLLRLVAGLEEASSGSIRIDGEDVTRKEPGDRDIAMVFQNYALYPHMTVRGNLAFPLETRKIPDAVDRVRETAELLQITDLLDRLPRELSGGQRQRVAIGRAIVRRPKLFLFDEPLSNLDAQLRGEMRTELARLHRRLDATILYVTHDQVEAMTLATRIVLLNHGRVEQEGTPEEMYQRPRTLFAGRFIGSPPMNAVQGAVKSGRFEGVVAWPVDGPDGPATLGVRPEDLEVGDGPWHGTVDLVEYLGAERHLHVKVAGVQMIARIGPGATFNNGDSVGLSPRNVHLFPRS
jgi:ABC-type sugar transport system ATPase subunit